MTEKKNVLLGIPITEELRNRIDAFATSLMQPGINVTRAAAARILLERALKGAGK